jgi:hypothetical protein
MGSHSQTNYTINTSSTSDTYYTLKIGPNTDIRMWNSSAPNYQVDPTGSLYSMNHANLKGELYIFGDYHIPTNHSDYWDYQKDFDGSTLTTPRQVKVYFAQNSTTTLDGGYLEIQGSSTATTTLQNQGSGTYSLKILSGTLNASHYQIRNTDNKGLDIEGTPTIQSLDYGDFLLEIDGGSLITVASTTIDANSSKIITGCRFATSTLVSGGYNVTEVGEPLSYWKFTLCSGNICGEAYDNDPGDIPGYIQWDDSNYNITISGHIYSDEGETAIGTIETVALVLDNQLYATTTCDSVDELCYVNWESGSCYYVYDIHYGCDSSATCDNPSNPSDLE